MQLLAWSFTPTRRPTAGIRRLVSQTQVSPHTGCHPGSNSLNSPTVSPCVLLCSQIQGRLLHKNPIWNISLSGVILINYRLILSLESGWICGAFSKNKINTSIHRSVLFPACSHSVLPKRLSVYLQGPHQQNAAPAAGDGKSLKLVFRLGGEAANSVADLLLFLLSRWLSYRSWLLLCSR